jgi:hypothetical protein
MIWPETLWTPYLSQVMPFVITSVSDQLNSRGQAHTLTDAPGQIAEYMHNLGLKYGVLTTYSQTIFLREVVHNMRWKLEFSLVIHNTDMFQPPSSVTLQMCYFHVVSLSSINSSFDFGGLRGQQWTESLRG